MAYHEKRGKRSWRFVVDVGYDANGERIRKTKPITIDDEALLKTTKRLKDYLDLELAKFEIEVKSGAYISPDKMNMGKFIDEWTKKFVNHELEEKTKDNYIFQAEKRIRPYFGHMRMDQIKTLHIMSFIEYLRTPAARLDGKDIPPGSATIVYAYRVLRSIFSKSIEWNLIKDSPMNGVKKPRENIPEMQYYDEKEIKQVFEALGNEDRNIRLLVILAMTTGMRRGELSGLEWSRVRAETPEIYISQTITKFSNGEPVLKPYPKNKLTRRISLANPVVEELKSFREHQIAEQSNIQSKWQEGKHNFVFCHPNGKPYDPHRLSKWWIAFHRKHNLKPIRFHDLRHTSVSYMILKKVQPEAISKRIGHKNEKTKEIYGHIFESVDRAAASVFDDMFTTDE